MNAGSQGLSANTEASVKVKVSRKAVADSPRCLIKLTAMKLPYEIT